MSVVMPQGLTAGDRIFGAPTQPVPVISPKELVACQHRVVRIFLRTVRNENRRYPRAVQALLGDRCVVAAPVHVLRVDGDRKQAALVLLDLNGSTSSQRASSAQTTVRTRTAVQPVARRINAHPTARTESARAGEGRLSLARAASRASFVYRPITAGIRRDSRSSQPACAAIIGGACRAPLRLRRLPRPPRRCGILHKS